MKRYLRRIFIGGVIVVMILNMLVSSLVFMHILRQNARTSLKTVIDAFFLLETPSEDACQAIADQISGTDNDLEAAFLREDGVLIASAPDRGGTGRSCASDADVRQALTGTWGEAIRPSRESGVYTLYVTRLIGDGLMLRLGYPLTAITTFLLVMLATGAAVCVFLIILLRMLSDRLCERLLRPLRLVNDLLHSTHESIPAPPQGEVFEEVVPLMDNISAMIRKLHYDFEEIKRTQQMRRDFVANASHELKSPLTSIKGFAELIQAGMVPSDKQRQEYIGRIVRESNRLLAIIEDILLLNRAESGRPENVTLVDMRAVADEAVQALESIAEKKSIRLSVAGHGHMTANAQEMWELIYNLVDNGVRYGKAGGFVRVRIDPDGLTVADNGIGMAQDQLPRIFERFYRVDKSHSRAGADGMPGGTGLGLSIVRHIALKYGGDVSVTSAPGEGTTFSVRLTDAQEQPENR
ncbi:MAG: hypothetical protein IJE08_09370 [Clostridia bacterium]|nr:hypothetical protein [Clostridia bacterium]